MFILISIKYKDTTATHYNMQSIQSVNSAEPNRLGSTHFDWSLTSKIYPFESESGPSIITVREALIGHSYFYAGKNSLHIPYGTVLGVLTYKRFREPVIYDPKRFVGSYICKFTGRSIVLEPDELLRKI